jgi:uncharacterized protein DUF3180
VKPTRPGPLVLSVVVLALAIWGVLAVLYADLPRLPWTMVPTLLLLGLGEAVTAYHLWRRIRRRPGTKPVEPLVVARMAALAKASAYAGAALAGVFGGFVIYLSVQLDKNTPRDDFVVSTGTVVAALVLTGAALFLEYACRVPKSPDDENASRT